MDLCLTVTARKACYGGKVFLGDAPPFFDKKSTFPCRHARGVYNVSWHGTLFLLISPGYLAFESIW